MNKEIREIIFKCQTKEKKGGKLHDLEKSETFIVGGWGKELKKTINFKLDSKNHKIAITFTSKKGLFGDKIYIDSLGQGEFMTEQEPVEIINRTQRANSKENQWRPAGKILAGGGVIGFLVILIGFFIWKRRKSKH